MDNQILLWVAFNVFVLAMLAVDLGVFHRRAHEVGLKEALIWSAVWIGLALSFNLGIYFWRGPEKALAFFTGYLIEKSLSVDNLFVFLMIFSYFRVPPRRQHKILFWGIVGALIMRALFILMGVTLISKLHWIIYIFGAFLVVTGVRMALERKKEIHPERNPVLKLFRSIMPVAKEDAGDRFFVRRDGRYMATPMFVVLLVIETTDLIFATDSIPAILAITTDAFIVYTSNVFAILGLRALYFALARIVQMFYYLRYGLAVVLSFVGVKMLLSGVYEISTSVALGVVAAILFLSVFSSILWPPRESRSANRTPAEKKQTPPTEDSLEKKDKL